MLVHFNRDRIFRVWIAREHSGSPSVHFDRASFGTMGRMYGAYLFGLNVILTAPPKR